MSKAENKFDGISGKGLTEIIEELRKERDTLQTKLKKIYDTFEQCQGETLPVYNDEMFRATWVREVVKDVMDEK